MNWKKYIDQGAKMAASAEAKRQHRLFQAQLNADMKKITKTLAELKNGGMTLEEEEEILRYASKPLTEAAQANAAIMHRKRVAVTTNEGRKKFYIERGNLKASIMEIRFKRRKHGHKGKLRGRKGGTLYFGPKVHWRPRNKQRFGPSVSHVNAYYAHFVEFGTRNQSPQPFMRPAYESTKGQVIGRAQAMMTRKIKAWAAQKHREAMADARMAEIRKHHGA